MTEYVHAVIDFIGQHPSWASLLVFLTAAAEAIALIGSVIPGTTILIGVGAIIGLGHLALWPILLWATLGAVVGDGLSYWLGHHYREEIVRVWPFSRRPELLSQGEALFHRHGGKSVAIGRFVPVMRAIVPVVAGILGMPPLRFYTANVLSAIVWAPAHILPGVVAGSALALVGGISGRLAAVLTVVILLAITGVWLLKIAVVRALPLLERAQIEIVSRARRHQGLAARLTVSALDPDSPSAGTILLLGAIVIACAIGFLTIVQDIVAGDPLVQADVAISHLIQVFRTAWADHLMVIVTLLGDTPVTASVAVVAVGWLIWRNQRRLAAGFVVTISLAVVWVFALKAVLRVPRPVALSSGADFFSFPSGHATIAAVLYGMLAWLMSSTLPRRWRLVPIVLGGTLVGLIAASRIYLAAHWPSDVAAGMLLGFGLAGVFALVYHRAPLADLHSAALAATVVVVLGLAGTWQVSRAFDASMQKYARRDQVKTIADLEWRGSGWQSLPRRRIDLDGETEEPFVLQWAGSDGELRERLMAAGWHQPVAWSLQSAAAFARSNSPVTALPALPLLHDGHRAAITVVVPGATEDHRTIFRAWPSGYVVTSPSGMRTILLASAIREQIIHPWNLASLIDEVDVPREEILRPLSKALSSTGDRPWLVMETAPGLLLATPQVVIR